MNIAHEQSLNIPHGLLSNPIVTLIHLKSHQQ